MTAAAASAMNRLAAATCEQCAQLSALGHSSRGNVRDIAMSQRDDVLRLELHILAETVTLQH